MKETTFIQKNSPRWKEIEVMLNSDTKIEPDHIYDLFIQLTDDLAYARTYYQNTQTAVYLNNLASKTYHIIYKNKKIKSNRIYDFWKINFPLLILKNRKYIACSFLIFIISFLIGILSSHYDTGFVRLILSDRYTNMTLENIRNGDPLAVYKSMNQADSFIAISLNNIYVSFLAFLGGFLVTLGTVYLLLQNGIMLGTFLYLFYQKHLLANALSVVFIHGTLEIFSIIVAGAAGILLGNSLVNTGTYGRMYTFKKGIREGISIVGGLIPVFLVAAFFEGFVTRYTSMPELLKLFIIFSSLVFIIYYFFIYPRQLKNKSYGTTKDRTTERT